MKMLLISNFFRNNVMVGSAFTKVPDKLATLVKNWLSLSLFLSLSIDLSIYLCIYLSIYLYMEFRASLHAQNFANRGGDKDQY